MNPKSSKSRPGQSGLTLAHGRFELTLERTRQLLKIGLTGLSTEIDKVDDILKMIPDVKGIPGPWPKGYELQVGSKKGPDGEVTWKMDRRTAHFVRSFMKKVRKQHRTLRFHLYSILAVYVWGAFETYLTMLFEELFTKCPDMLKSDQTVTFCDVIERSLDPVELLIERELNRLGHFTLDEWLEYLDDKINVCCDTPEKRQLAESYLIRNIIAHNTGLIRADLQDKVPSSTGVRDNEIRVTKTFLLGMLDTIETTERRIEAEVVSKFFRGRRTGPTSSAAG